MSTTHFPRIHDVMLCVDEPCPWHNPSDHHMVGWPKLIRYDRLPMITERICPTHGVGHPDPDTIAWAKRIMPPDGNAADIHGCCGCCVDPDTQ